MPGLPLGAAQQHSVPAELKNYESIVGIEFIETTAGLPYPRSAAYRLVDGGAQMRVRDKAPELADVQLDEKQARAYIDALVDSGVFGWHRVYRPAQGTFVLDGTNWRVEFTFAKAGALKRPRPFRVEGENTFPDGYEDVVRLLMKLPERGVEGESASSADSADRDA